MADSQSRRIDRAGRNPSFRPVAQQQYSTRSDGDVATHAQGWTAGLGTWIEEGGTGLSGGQRRRLTIARALLRQAPIPLLDEPGEERDPLAETTLTARITAHLKGRTLMWISHRDGFDAAFDRAVRIGA